MKREEPFIDRLHDLWPEEGPASAEALELVEEAVRNVPRSARLWVMRGDLLQLVDEPDEAQLERALASYQRALSIDHTFADAHEAIGYYCDALLDNYEDAEHGFRAAIRFGAGVESWFGLARVLAQDGRKGEALKMLHDDHSAHPGHPDLAQLRAEIEEGLWDPPESEAPA